MQRLARLLALALLAALSAFGGSMMSASVLAQDGPSAEEIRRRVEWVRQLPPDDRAKLKEALARFRAMPAEDRDRLRKKAARVGVERLEGLAGRDLDALEHTRTTLVAEAESILAAIGPERLAGLSDAELAYVRSEAMRGFQRHVQRRVLGLSTYDDLERMPAAEKRARTQESMRKLVDDQFARLPDDEQARIRALPTKDRAAARAQLFAEFRMAETRDFAKIFDRYRLQPFQQMPPEKRAERVRKWQEQARWFAVVRTLREDIVIGDEARRALASLGPAEWARINHEIQQTESMPPLDRRRHLEQLIQRLAGERALDPSRRSDLPPALRRLRERRLLLNPTAPSPEAPR